MENGPVRIGLFQMRCGSVPEENLRRAEAAVAKAAQDGAHMVCLPELFRSRYFCQSEDIHSFDLAEPIPGPTSERLCALAAAHKVVIIASLFERRAAGIYHNTAVIFGADGTIAGRYRKAHIPDDPRYYEKFYFTPGDLDFAAFPTAHGPIGTLVCWDQWFPEAARLVALAGAQILFYPTAIGWELGETETVRRRQYDAWQTVQRGHAIANGIFVAAVNRVGAEDGLQFWGGSFVADPFGQVLAQASFTDEETLMVDCDPRLIEETRRNWPFLRDRRIDAYNGLLRRFRL